MTLATAQALRAGGPWGQGFAEPVFDGRFTVLDSRIVGERHLKLRVRPEGDAAVLDGIAFNFLAGGERALPANTDRVQLAYRLDVNEYQGLERLQLVVEHLC
jgi:single-stranded-DNA-specific exonuclease